MKDNTNKPMVLQDNDLEDQTTPEIPITQDPHSLAALQQKTKVSIKRLIELNEAQSFTEREKARALKCSQPVLRDLQAKLGIIQHVNIPFNTHRADIYAEAQRRIMDFHLSDSKIQKASFKDAMWVMAVLADKEYREREKGSVKQGLSQLLHGIHIDIKEGATVVISPYTKESAVIDITPQKAENPQAITQDVVVDSTDDSDDAEECNEINEL